MYLKYRTLFWTCPILTIRSTAIILDLLTLKTVGVLTLFMTWLSSQGLAALAKNNCEIFKMDQAFKLANHYSFSRWYAYHHCWWLYLPFYHTVPFAKNSCEIFKMDQAFKVANHYSISRWYAYHHCWWLYLPFYHTVPFAKNSCENCHKRIKRWQKGTTTCKYTK